MGDTHPATVMPERDRDEDTGQYTSDYTPDDFLDALHRAGGAADTSTVAEEANAGYDVTYKYLRQLEDEGRVTADRVANARLWRLVDNDGKGD